MVTLSLTDPASGAVRTIVTQVAMPVVQSGDEPNAPAPSPVTPTESAQSCEALSLALGPVDLDLLGMAVRLDQANVDVISRSTGRLGIVLCGATGVIDRGVTPAERIRVLNTLLDVVG